LLQRLARVKLLSLDVDGVLTDGGLYFTDDGHQFRKFNVKDGMGMQRVRDAGIEVAILSAGSSSAVEERAKSLGIQHVFIGVADKLAVISRLCQDLGIGLDDVGHVGDDLNDVPMLSAVGCPISVSDAVSEAREAAVFVTERRGGDGAVREICDLLLVARTGAE
jgi:3-deoxy-D-manno-octulosonate 8-phosphate phosphatase (KDO 8-P phosphatase)